MRRTRNTPLFSLAYWTLSTTLVLSFPGTPSASLWVTEKVVGHEPAAGKLVRTDTVTDWPAGRFPRLQTLTLASHEPAVAVKDV